MSPKNVTQKGKIRNRNVGHSIKSKPVGEKGYLSNLTEGILLAFMAIVVVFIIIISPFFRGLHFPKELLISNLATYVLLITWGVYRIAKNEGYTFKSPLDICLFVLLLAYTSSFFVAVHMRDALTEVLKNLSYIIIYLVSIDIGRNLKAFWIIKTNGNNNNEIQPPGVQVLFHAALLAAFSLSLASLGVAAGNWDFPYAMDSGRIASPIGYANTAAAYFMAAYFLSIALMATAKKWSKKLYLVPASVLLITLILTYSRGVWLLFPIVGLFLIIFSARDDKLFIFNNLIATVLTAVPMSILANSMLTSNNPNKVWLIVLIAIIASVFLSFIFEYIVSKNIKLRFHKSGIVASSVIIIVVIVALFISLYSTISISRLENDHSDNKLQQLVDPITPEQFYNLDVVINSEIIGESKVNNEKYWRIKILGGLNDYSYVELLNHQAKLTGSWQEYSFSFQTPEDIRWLEIIIWNEAYNTKMKIHSATLKTTDKEINLSFFAYRLLPSMIYDRLFTSSRYQNMDLRFLFFKDAIRIIKDYPILGTGGGGWAAIYKSYQEQYYNSRQVHNHYLQVWVEAGLFGFLAYIGIWISFAISFYYNITKSKFVMKRRLWNVSFIPVIALGIHSIIDWNFSMASVGYFIFALMGAGMSLDETIWFKRSDSTKRLNNRTVLITGLLAVIVGIVMFIFAFRLLAGLQATWRSQELVNENNVKGALLEIEKAIKLDPFRAENYHNLNVIIEEQATRLNNPDIMDGVIDNAKKAYNLEPYNINYSNRYGYLMLYYVSIEDGLNMLDHSLELNPFNVDNYLYSAFSRLNLVEFYQQSGNMVEVNRYLGEIIEINQIMMDKGINGNEMLFILGRAHHLAGSLDLALFYYEDIMEEDYYYEEAQQFINEILTSTGD